MILAVSQPFIKDKLCPFVSNSVAFNSYIRLWNIMKLILY